VAKTGRNDPCPCGSGQKYKRCCLPRDDAADAARAAELARAQETESAVRSAALRAASEADDDGLDEASNGVLDLIRVGRLDEAEQAARQLLEKYPDVHDGHERLAMVYAARGDRPQAAAYYRQAADFVHAHADQYEPTMEMYFRKRVAEFEAPQE
jgi:tetratricopeptide (TPR) repeat protein